MKISSPHPVEEHELKTDVVDGGEIRSVSFRMRRRDPLKTEAECLHFQLGTLFGGIEPAGDLPLTAVDRKQHSVKIRLAKTKRALWGRLCAARTTTPPFVAFDHSSVDDCDDDADGIDDDDTVDAHDAAYEAAYPFAVYRAKAALERRRKMAAPPPVLLGGAPEEEPREGKATAAASTRRPAMDEISSEEELDDDDDDGDDDEDEFRIEAHERDARGCGGNTATEDGMLTKRTGRRK